ncbi:MAG TPA: proton-conducting transporter membrane subunit, partial [Spirochaetia bacterium]|nr:proton-conducting transporter membrane subunit [Spirochaetia bacterium]
MSVNFLLVPVLLPFAVGVLILFIPRALKGVKEALTFIAMALVLAAAVRIATLDGLSFSFALFEMGTFSVAFDLNSSTLSSFVLILITGFGFLISLYSISYMAGKERLREYYAFMLFAVGGSSGVVLVDNLLLFLIFWEIVTASLYFLITTGQPEAKAGATKTFAMIGAADGLLLMGIGLVWYIARTLRISDISISTGSLAGTVAFILMMMGAITKAGSMPLHTWIPAAGDGAPASVMALLPAALDKLLGIFLLLRVATGLFTPGEALSILLMALGAVTILSGVMMAMVQHDLRRLLSYHAISQVGYMVLGIGTMNPIGIVGGLFHMVNNSIYKSCLFLCAGAVERKTGTNDLGSLGGLGRSMPFTFVACLTAALAISGVPPFNGFVSKWLVYQGIIGTGSRYGFVF